MNTIRIILALWVVLLFQGSCSVHKNADPEKDVSKVTDSLTFQVRETKESIDRGERLALLACNRCHAGEHGRLTGKLQQDTPKMIGKVYSRNITNDPEFGIGTWTPIQIARLIRTGIKPDGKRVNIVMPQFPHMSDEDLSALIVFLKSDRYIVQPEAVKIPESSISLIGKLATAVVQMDYTYPEQPVPGPDTSSLASVGEYLVDDILQCFSCHASRVEKLNYNDPQHSKGYLGGGIKLTTRSGTSVRSANLTFDPESGIGHYSEEEFRQVLKLGRKKDGNPVRYPMMPFPALTDEEINAIYAYLQTVPVIRNKKLMRAKKG